MSIILLTCDTKLPKCSNRIRWETSVQNQNLNYYVMSTGLKWEGWKWRIQQYLDTLLKLNNENKYKYAIITDCWDLIIQRNLTLDDYAKLDNCIYLGAEKQKTGILEFNEKYDKNPWYNINGGFSIGKISNLVTFYTEVINKWDTCVDHVNRKHTNNQHVIDQHVISYVYLYSKFPFTLKLDISKEFVLNFTRDVTQEDYIIESDYIYSKTNKNVYLPIALHNPGNPTLPINKLMKIFDNIVYKKKLL